MKIFTSLFSLFLLSATISKAQISYCDADFSLSNITFSAISFGGDSAIYIDITNNSGLNYAYPQAKLFNTTALPPGMTLNSTFQNWYPFASSYNNNQTSNCPFGYDVNMPIPANYMVTFTLWMRPNDTAVGYDSCRFQQDFTVNLNPQTGIFESGIVAANVVAFPNPANATVTFSAMGNSEKFVSAKMINLQGQEIFVSDLNHGELNISGMAEGMYFVFLYDKNGNLTGKSKLVKN